MKKLLVITISADGQGCEIGTDHVADSLGLRSFEWCQAADVGARLAEIWRHFLAVRELERRARRR